MNGLEFQAVILAGGKGTRLHPYSAQFPKPLVPIDDRPVLELLLMQLRAAGSKGAILTVSHLRHLIEAYFSDGSRIGLPITYSVENEPLGTAGPIGPVLDRLDEDFVVANGDLLTNLNFADLVVEHRKIGADATVAVYKRAIKVDFGVVEADERHFLSDYHEKPSREILVSMGVYVLNRESVRPFLQAGRYRDMPNLLLAMKDSGKTVYCHDGSCVWYDIGNPEDLAKAQKEYQADPHSFLPG